MILTLVFAPPRVLYSQQLQDAVPLRRSHHQIYAEAMVPARTRNPEVKQTVSQESCLTQHTYDCLVGVIKIWIPSYAHHHLVYTTC